MGRVKIKHPCSRDVATRKKLLNILGTSSIRVTRLIPTRDAVIVLTGSDKDSDGIFREDVQARLTEAGFEAVMPPELRCQRAVICFRLDDLLAEYDTAEIQAEIERCQSWAKVADLYRFPRSNTIKITFQASEMAEKACDRGLLLFYFSIPPIQMRREVYVHLIACDRCQVLEDHNTSECPFPASYKLCSECGQEGHIYRECKAPNKSCFNCKQAHSARAMRCPARKRALREKEERLRKDKASPHGSFAQTAAHAQSQPPPVSSSSPYAEAHGRGYYCILMHAHIVNCGAPGTFQATVSAGLKLNGLPDVKLPPNPPSRAILEALGPAGMTGKVTATAAHPPTSSPPPPEEPSQRPPPPTVAHLPPPPPADERPPPPEAPPEDPSQSPPPTATRQAPAAPTPVPSTAPEEPITHTEDAFQPLSPPTPAEDSTQLPSPATDFSPASPQHDGEDLHVFLVKSTLDDWPDSPNWPTLQKGLKEGRYKVVHDGDDGDTEDVLSWLERIDSNTLAEICHSAPPALHAAITESPGTPHVIRQLLPDSRRRRHQKWTS